MQTVNAQTRIAELHRRIEFSDVVSREQLDEEARAIYETIIQNIKDRKTIEAIASGLEARLGYSFSEEDD